jgi:hypothetical protein
MIEKDRHIDPRIEKIWQFVRGDLKTNDFEQWIYSDQGLEELLGKALYLEIISVNYSDKNALFKTKKRLSEYARQATRLRCKCVELADTDIVNIGEESDLFFKYVETTQKRGEPYWWLSVDKCRECGQWWLVGSEERQNDLYCLRRLDEQTADQIVSNNIWPNYFDKYETLLRLGYEAGISVRFVDPIGDSSLKWTIADLAKERPGIAISDIAKLLNIDKTIAAELARKAVKDDNIHITFDD